MEVFDRTLLRRRRDRAAASLAAHGFLFREVAGRLTERLEDINRRFPVALDLGCHGGEVAETLGTRGGTTTLVQCDLSERMARLAAANANRPAVAADEEALPFGAASFDLVLSSLSLHWVNDLPGALVQIRYALRPDGLFLAAMFGGDTLKELREVWMDAELAEEDGAGAHVAPFADIRDAGGLLQRAGFALPVADAETITVTYPDAFMLLNDLRGMGEANVALTRTARARRATLDTMARLYKERYGDAQGRVPATFQVIFLTAWAPHESQQKPLRPGTAETRLADALGTEEKPAGDKAGR